MPLTGRKKTRYIEITTIALGVLLTVISIFFSSSYLAIFGLAIAFWGAILLYITPTRNVPLSLLNASLEGGSENTERILFDCNLSEKGFYMPPKNLTNVELSLVFIPKKPKTSIPLASELAETTILKQDNGVFITPSGLGLSRLFEKHAEISFSKMDLNQFCVNLPKLLVEDLEVAEGVVINLKEKTVVIVITGSIFSEVCKLADANPRMHAQLGCLLPSALACVLAKVTGKPITIQEESSNQEAKTMQIIYQIFEDEDKGRES